MLFMNEYEVEGAYHQYGDHPVLAAATDTLMNLMNWTNSNSDGWAYWPKPCRAAEKLQALIQEQQRLDRNRDPRERESVTAAEYKAALRPIKSFRTRFNADFEIVEVK